MKTYDEIKTEYPLGCEVKLRSHEEFHNGEPFGWTPQGRIIAILDPKKHGPKCLLFKIEKTEGGKISNESAASTIRRKLSFSGNTGMLSWSAPEECLEKRGVLHSAAVNNPHGLLKWIAPSDVKERVGKKGAGISMDEASERMQKAGRAMREAADNPKTKDTMDRTEELRKSLRAGMKVKLKGHVEDWPENNSPKFHPEMAQDLGSWIEVGCYVSQDRFVGKGNSKGGWFWPITMIEKVEGEEEPDTIPVPREKVKEILKEAVGYTDDSVQFIKKLMEDEAIDGLLQEIEEEEKYVNNLRVNSYKNICSDDDPNPVAAVYRDKIVVAKGRYVPEIHKEGGQYVVKFKREG